VRRQLGSYLALPLFRFDLSASKADHARVLLPALLTELDLAHVESAELVVQALYALPDLVSARTVAVEDRLCSRHAGATFAQPGPSIGQGGIGFFCRVFAGLKLAFDLIQESVGFGLERLQLTQ
jgi:hypothetical protein